MNSHSVRLNAYMNMNVWGVGPATVPQSIPVNLSLSVSSFFFFLLPTSPSISAYLVLSCFILQNHLPSLARLFFVSYLSARHLRGRHVTLTGRIQTFFASQPQKCPPTTLRCHLHRHGKSLPHEHSRGICRVEGRKGTHKKISLSGGRQLDVFLQRNPLFGTLAISSSYHNSIHFISSSVAN